MVGHNWYNNLTSKRQFSLGFQFSEFSKTAIDHYQLSSEVNQTEVEYS